MAGKNHRIGKSLIEIQQSFGTEEKCQAYLEAARWPEGVRCLKCDSNKISKFVTNETSRERVNRKGKTVTVRVPARTLYQCLNAECVYQFSATTGTLFNDSHLPLSKWFQGIALMCNAKKGLSAKQMERDLGVNYRTAWYLNHRIRKAMDEGMSLFTGVVEVDETYIGGAYDRRRKRERHATQPVFGAVQRATETEHSKVRAFPIPTNSTTILTGAVKGNVSMKAELLISDEAIGYRAVGKQYQQHETVKHIHLEYKRKGDPRNIHTNSIEGFWSLFKRGLIGSFHKVSVKHLHRYLNEFEFRFNHRRNEEMFALVILNLVIASAMPYAQLIGKSSESDAEPSEGAPF
jgi:ISXO2 transposase-like protein/transposase-like zinc ribbon protein